MEPHLPHGRLGLYIHVPWCLTRCPYCVFFALPYSRKAFERYVTTLEQEKALYLPIIDRPLSSVYFGGGTPSLLSATQINAILSGLPLCEDAEITLELNPIQITPVFVQQLASTAVNRISLGVQSLDDTELMLLGRKHKAADIAPAIKLLRDGGFTNLSADLIYGLPNSSAQLLSANLEQFLSLPIEHLSCYLLEISFSCALAHLIGQIPPDEMLAEEYHLIRKMAADAGFAQYEISNFARQGYQSRHNLLYWQGDDYLALGASASGHFGGVKYQNPADIDRHYQNVTAGILFPESDNGRFEASDYIMMRLRLIEGLNFSEYHKRFGHSFGREAAIRKLQQMGMLEQIKDGIRLSDDALFISNAVIAELL